MPALAQGSFLHDPLSREEKEQVDVKEQLYLKALENFMPACILVDEKNRIQHLFGDCSNYIHMPAGNFTSDIFNLLTPDLRIAVSTALKATRDKHKRITYLDIAIKGEREAQKISLTAAPLDTRSGEASEFVAIVLMTPVDKELKNGEHYDIDRVAAQRITDLEQELNDTHNDLKHTITELESVNEELQAANEELLTANEELQSSNEELQSVNEELYTVNSEYQQKANELVSLNDDLNNFLSTNLIGILFIDDKYRVRKYTNYIMREFNMLPQDVGRPLQYIAYNFVNVDLLSLSKQVATSQTPIECDVASVSGKPYFLRIAPYITDEKKMLGLVLTFVDVTRKYTDSQQMEAMHDALKHAQNINTQKNSFMSRMSHDMRTPLHTIQGLVYLSMDHPGLDKYTRDNLQKIHDASQYLLGIITDILDSSMIENNKMKIQEVPTWENELLEEVEDMVLLQAEKRRIVFSHSVVGGKNRCLLIDKTHVVQILTNLLSNAVKFTPESGKIEFTTEIKELTANRVQHTYIIRDNGIGMSPEFVKKMYQPFEQAKDEEQNAGRGVGLGLHIAQSLVKLLGGTIDCQSTEGKGSTFTVTLTYNLASKEQLAALVNAPEANYTLLKGRKVLVCDDHAINRTITIALLESKGLEVQSASNGQEAVKAYMESAVNEFDFILMDIRMPIMDGLQATMKIRSCPRADAKKIPIIALTANALEEEEHVCLEAGMSARLTKPLNPKDMYKLLTKFILAKQKAK